MSLLSPSILLQNLLVIIQIDKFLSKCIEQGDNSVGFECVTLKVVLKHAHRVSMMKIGVLCRYDIFQKERLFKSYNTSEEKHDVNFWRF